MHVANVRYTFVQAMLESGSENVDDLLFVSSRRI